MSEDAAPAGGGPAAHSRLVALIGPSRFDSLFENPQTGRSDDRMEGLYLRTEAAGVVTGRAKYVRAEVIEKVIRSEHWQPQALTPSRCSMSTHPGTRNSPASTGGPPLLRASATHASAATIANGNRVSFACETNDSSTTTSMNAVPASHAWPNPVPASIE